MKKSVLFLAAAFCILLCGCDKDETKWISDDQGDNSIAGYLSENIGGQWVEEAKFEYRGTPLEGYDKKQNIIFFNKESDKTAIFNFIGEWNGQNVEVTIPSVSISGKYYDWRLNANKIENATISIDGKTTKAPANVEGWIKQVEDHSKYKDRQSYFVDLSATYLDDDGNWLARLIIQSIIHY